MSRGPLVVARRTETGGVEVELPASEGLQARKFSMSLLEAELLGDSLQAITEDGLLEVTASPGYQLEETPS